MKFLLTILFAASLVAQEAVAPTLSDVEKLQLTTRYLQYENAKLKLDAAQGELMRYMQSLNKEGYTLDISTFTYVPVAEKK